MKPLTSILSIGLALLIQACGGVGSGNINRQDDCNAPGLEWMEGVEGYDKREVFDLATKFQLAARSNADKIVFLNDASSQESFAASLKEIINNTTGRKAKVSQEFFEKANSYRTTVCNIERWLKDGTLSDPAIRLEAQRQLLTLSSGFSTIADDLRKRIEQLEGRMDQTEKAIKPIPLTVRLRQLLTAIDSKILPLLKEGTTKFSGGITSTQFNDLQKIAKEPGADKYIYISPDVRMGIGFGPEGVSYGVDFNLSPSLLSD